MADAQLSGEGLLVEFKVTEESKDNYSDSFEAEPTTKRTVPRVEAGKVKNAFKEMRLIMMIKKIPKTHML